MLGAENQTVRLMRDYDVKNMNNIDHFIEDYELLIILTIIHGKLDRNYIDEPTTILIATASS